MALFKGRGAQNDGLGGRHGEDIRVCMRSQLKEQLLSSDADVKGNAICMKT